MKNKKDELQNIIIGNGQVSYGNKLKKVQNFLRENASASVRAEKQKYLKSEEEDKLRAFIQEENLYYDEQILEDDFITEGAEQRVYRLDDFSVIKLNDSIFYEYWYDYFNSLLIHNYFFHTTAYQFLGFKFLNDKLYAVVKQDFIVTDEVTDTNIVKNFLEYNNFRNVRNNDYINVELGIIFEDLHDENVLTKDGAFYFIDTIFYLTEKFFH